MALSKQEIEAAIRDAVREVSGINRDNLTVNYIRKFTEEKLNLEEGFFSEPEWKSRSRALIKETAESLDTASQQQESSPAKPKTDPTPAPKPLKNTVDDDDDEEPPKKKKPVARSKARKTAASDEDNGSPPKAKRARKPHKVLDSEPEDDDPEDDFGSDGDNSDDFSQDDSEEEAKPTKKRKAGPAPKKPAKKRKTVPDDEDEKAPVDESSALSDAPPDEDSELSDVMDESPKPKPKAKSKTQPKKAAPVKKATPVKPKKQPAKSPSGENDGDEPAVKSKPDAEDAESSELSDVLDEPPKPKRGAKSKDAAPAKPRAPRKSGAAASDDPDEAEVKKLQSQLVKCGIRKVWGVELRGCGGDPKAKIKHLRGMLRDAGMDGRFSEARAREIKERRELEADLEAVKEMDAAWGIGGRASRSKAKVAVKEASDEGSGAGEEGGNDGSEEEVEDFGVSSKARGRSGAQADLAFLDDDDESGSDDSE
ncbi:hypothetical protein HYQ45_007824 [Verticillium longisporum]|uniref:Transcriptional regulator n=1 Tax=Verticillium longisporum TaxID=100787 RepID=A0A0G4MFN7_VERLO|nr:hypothetical protein HYQ44_014427 [Verticillium longisporum]KAG7134141.1 hypothetical protein HYQ45_007824 [Verticillium longisporum]CRK33031.1 hypothetical protein BN1708_005976 [Verticillium longisporum]